MSKHKLGKEKINVKRDTSPFQGTRICASILLYWYENPSGYIAENMERVL